MLGCGHAGRGARACMQASSRQAAGLALGGHALLRAAPPAPPPRAGPGGAARADAHAGCADEAAHQGPDRRPGGYTFWGCGPGGRAAGGAAAGCGRAAAGCGARPLCRPPDTLSHLQCTACVRPAACGDPALLPTLYIPLLHCSLHRSCPPRWTRLCSARCRPCSWPLTSEPASWRPAGRLWGVWLQCGCREAELPSCRLMDSMHAACTAGACWAPPTDAPTALPSLQAPPGLPRL